MQSAESASWGRPASRTDSSLAPPPSESGRTLPLLSRLVFSRAHRRRVLQGSWGILPAPQHPSVKIDNCRKADTLHPLKLARLERASQDFEESQKQPFHQDIFHSTHDSQDVSGVAVAESRHDEPRPSTTPSTALGSYRISLPISASCSCMEPHPLNNASSALPQPVNRSGNVGLEGQDISWQSAPRSPFPRLQPGDLVMQNNPMYAHEATSDEPDDRHVHFCTPSVAERGNHPNANCHTPRGRNKRRGKIPTVAELVRQSIEAKTLDTHDESRVDLPPLAHQDAGGAVVKQEENRSFQGIILHIIADISQSIGLAIAGAILWYDSVPSQLQMLWLASARTRPAGPGSPKHQCSIKVRAGCDL